MNPADPSSDSQGADNGKVELQRKNIIAPTASDDRAITSPPAPTSSVLYTLLQDLGLKATAQALCDELQRQQQQSCTASRSPPSAASLPSHASEIFESLPTIAGVRLPNSLGLLLSSPHAGDQALTLSSVHPLPASADTSLTTPAAPHAVRVSRSASSACDVSVELQRRLQPHRNASQCTQIIASLAACAVEPLVALLAVSTSSSASALESATVAPLQLVEMLNTLWQAERRAVLPVRATPGTTDAAAARTEVHEPQDRGFQVAALISRAAWCELRITELVFMQELYLAHTSGVVPVPSAAVRLLQEAQHELADVAGQLVAALQELRATCGAAGARCRGMGSSLQGVPDASPTCVGTVIASSIVARLHSKSIGWLNNAECVMAWILRRHDAFEQVVVPPPTPSCLQQQQRKRRCLEAHTTSATTATFVEPAPNIAASPLLQPLQDVILGLPNGTLGPAPSYQQCLDAEIARSATAAAALAKSAGACKVEPKPATTACETNALFSSVHIPTTVRVAMTVQRIKLLPTLISALVFNGEDSILGLLEAAPTDHVRHWWSRQCAMMAQFLMQCAHQLMGLLKPPMAQSPTGAQTTPPLRPRTLTAASEAVLISLRNQLEVLAKELLLSTCPVVGIPPSGPGDSRLAFFVRLMDALQQAQDSRLARLDWYVLKNCTTASTAVANAVLSASSPLSAVADVVFSPLSSDSGPTFASDGSPSTSPLWTLRVPSPPGTGLRGSTEQPVSSTLAHRGSIGSDTSSMSDSLEASRIAAQVLQWKSHFTQLLATVATGRWHAKQDAPQPPYPGSRYHRLRIRMRDAMMHAQELLRLQPRQQAGARGLVYTHHPIIGSGPAASTALSVVEQIPLTLQLATMENAHLLQKRLQCRLARKSKLNGFKSLRAKESHNGTAAAAARVTPPRGRYRASPSSASQSRISGPRASSSVGEYHSASSVLAVATATAHQLLDDTTATVANEADDQATSSPSLASSEETPGGHDATRSEAETRSSALGVATASTSDSPEPQWEIDDDDDENEDDVAETPQLVRWNLQSESEEEEEEEVADADADAEEEEAEEEEEEEEEEEVRSQASSADMDYERAEDGMKEEVECVETTPDGRLLALLTARGKLMVLRLQSHDSTRRYEEEVLLDTTLPNMPSHGKRLQWYESLSSILCFSPCHRFIIASVQFAAIEAPPNTSLAMAPAAKEATGQLNIYSLHRDSDYSEDTATDGRVAATPKKKMSVSSSSGSAHDRLHRLVGASTDRLYGTFRPHEGSCLSARWVDPRWWGGGRRSQWANSALEPLNSSKVAASMLVKPTETEETAKSFVSFRENGSATEPVTIPPESWRAAAGVLLSEYQCVSVGVDDLILRWLPASGLVLQRILTEPVQDIIVSPLMAAFYVACDNGDLYMYDAWDERNVMDGNSCGSGDGVDSCNVYLTSPNTTQTHRLVLPVTEEGHPRFHRVGGPQQQKQQQQQQQQRSQRRDVAEDPDSSDLVHSSRSYAHYAGPVTPVFQRIVDPSRGTLGSQQQMCFFAYHPYSNECATTAECGFDDDDSDDDEHGSGPADGKPAQGSSNRTESGQTKRGAGRIGWSGLPQNLRWLLPNQWAAHTPWDAQLGRRLIRNLLRQTDSTTSTDIGELFYERDEETAGVAATLAATNDDSHQPSLLDEQGNSAGAVSGARDEEGGTSGGGRGQQDVSSNDEHSDFDSSEREYAYTNGADYDDDDDGARRPLPSKVINGHDSSYIASEATATAAAAAKGAPVSVLECAAHPTPARGPLQRAYYPSGACLVYKSVAKALCSAGDLADRQTHSEMGPGGPTHHLLYMAFSGEPQWMAERRLWDREAEEAGATQRGQCRYNQNGTATDCDNAHREGRQTQQLGGESEPSAFCGSSAPFTLWSTAALARVLLWKDYFSTSRYLAAVKPQTWSEWESDVLATTYHADVLPPSNDHSTGTIREPRWSAAELLAARGYFGPRDAWRRCAPASQRGLAATARNGRYLCIMASVGPYRKLVNPREPLREMAGFYACLVFDVYAGAVLRVIPVCPTELTGLCGRYMWTSERHENDPKAPIYRLPCTVTVVPLNAQPVGPTAPGSGANMTLSSRPRVGSNAAPGGLRPHGNLPTLLQIDEAVVGDEEDGEPSEVVVLTVGGLGNSIFVFDALSGRRLVHETELTRHCAEAATAAYEVSNLAAKMRAKSRGARSDGAKPSGSSAVPHIPATPVAAPSVASSQPPFSSSMAAPAPPTSTRKPADVLASVAGWGRGTGFGVIADRSVSTASVTEMPAIRDADGGVGGDSPSVVLQNHADTDEQTATATAVLPVSGESTQSGAPVPWLLQGAAPTQLGGWHLRGILWWVHRNPQPSTLYGDDDGGATSNHNASWSLHSTAPSEANIHAGVGGGLKGNDGTGAANNSGAAPSSSNITTSVTNSALSFFYQTLLGVSGMASTAATRRPHALSAAPSELPASRRQASGSLSSALKAGTAGSLPHNAGTTSFNYASVWKQRRRRLLQRLLRHYDVAMLWQAYVTLFAASTTATGSLAPQSSVCALVQWALSTDKAANAATTFLGPTIGHTPWTWCSTSAYQGESRCTPTPSKQPHLPVCTGKQRVARRHDVEHSDTIDGGTGGNISACNTVPFAHVLQQRDEFLFELQALDGHTQHATGGEATTASPARSTSRGQAKSLLSEIRAQASAEGILPLTAKARTAQQQQESSGRESFSPAGLKLPPAHHQNQLHVDAINCVATWIDANGGFYLCCGSEDGGLYIMGGNVMA